MSETWDIVAECMACGWLERAETDSIKPIGDALSFGEQYRCPGCEEDERHPVSTVVGVSPMGCLAVMNERPGGMTGPDREQT